MLQQADVLFLSDMAAYMHNEGDAKDLPHAPLNHLAWWSWNPNSGDTGGLVQDDWATVSLAAPILALSVCTAQSTPTCHGGRELQGCWC